MSDETIAEAMERSEAGTPMDENLSGRIAARRKKIRDDAACEECGSTLAACEAQRGKDPTAPPWFGCCARESGMAPCSHKKDPQAIWKLLDEAAAGSVRTVEEITPKSKPPRPDGAPGNLAVMFDQGVWWRQKSGAWIKIADMSPGHRYNTAAMVLRAARPYGFAYEMWFAGEVGAHEGGDMAHESLERELDLLHERVVNDPQGWMRETAMYKALTAGLTIQGDGTQPWQKTRRDAVTGEPRDVPPPMTRVCEIPACGCSGLEHE
jgi:hypothetical protein